METTSFNKEVVCVGVYMDRNRGVNSWKNYFVVFQESKGITWYIEPVNKCISPEAVMQVHSIDEEHLLFGGRLTKEEIDVSLVRVSLDNLLHIIVSAFRVPQPHAPNLAHFVDARVRVESMSSDLGTVRDVIKKSASGF